MALVRTLIALQSDELEERVRAAIELTARFELVSSDLELVDAVLTTGVDLVVLRAASLDQALLDRLALAGGGRPIPSVVIVPAGTVPERKMRPRLQQARCTTLSESLVMRGDDAAQDHVVERFTSVAERVRAGSRRTLSDTMIEDAMDEVMQSGVRAGIETEVAQLAAWPVDLVVLAGSKDAADFLLEVFDELISAPVPILLSLRGADEEELARRLAAVSRVPINGLDGWCSIREIRGVLVAPSRGVTLSGDRITTGAPSDSGSYGKTLLSLSTLSDRLCVIMLEDPMPDIAREISGLRSTGALVAVAAHDGEPRTRGPQSLLDDGIATATFDAKALGWYLGHAIPRRD